MEDIFFAFDQWTPFFVKLKEEKTTKNFKSTISTLKYFYTKVLDYKEFWKVAPLQK